MYKFNCKECRNSVPLINKDNEIMYFRLGTSEEFYCKKCFENMNLEENDKVLREGKNFVTVQQSDY